MSDAPRAYRVILAETGAELFTVALTDVEGETGSPSREQVLALLPPGVDPDAVRLEPVDDAPSAAGASAEATLRAGESGPTDADEHREPDDASTGELVAHFERVLRPVLLELAARGRASELDAAETAARLTAALLEDPALVRDAESFHRGRGPRPHLEADDVIAMTTSLIAFGALLAEAPAAAVLAAGRGSPLDKLKKLVDDVEKGVETGKKAATAGKDLAKEIKELAKGISDAGKGKTGGSTTTTPPGKPAPAGPQPTKPEEQPAPQDDGLPPNAYLEGLEGVSYTIWLDRVIAHHVTGWPSVKADNVYWFSSAAAVLKNPAEVRKTVCLSSEYDLDEREEVRLSPLDPDRVPKHGGYKLQKLRPEQGLLSAGYLPLIAWLPDARLASVTILLSVSESDHIEELEGVIAAVAKAALEAFTFYSGKWQGGDTSKLTDDIRDAVKKLLRFLNSDERLVSMTRTFSVRELRAAFAGSAGQRFDGGHDSVALTGLPKQREVEARTNDGRSVEGDAAAAYLSHRDDTEHLYELWLRFERHEAAP